MKRISTYILSLILPLMMMAQGWPSNYNGVMLQGFYWDSYSDTQWSHLESQADELAQYFSLIWVPNSAYCGSTTTNMGYSPVYWYNHLSAFGTEPQLRSMIKTFKAKGTGVIEDVVINHRSGVKGWIDFPEENVNGTSWKLTTADICNNDECVAAGYNVTGAADTGDNFDGARDLDHTSANVQKNVKNYLNYLLNDLGYAGVRYDMVKGYSPKYTSIYNQYANPTFSVGEYWDSYDNIVNWVNGTKDGNGVIRSAAFDFPLKYKLNEACNSSNWSALTNRGLVGNAAYCRYAVTFIDNHDTYRNDSKLTGNELAGNAFILTTPGTPCVFLPHWQSHKNEIKQMILARQLAAINSQSLCTEAYKDPSNRFYAVKTTGDKASLITILGNAYGVYDPATTSDMTLILSGTNYAVYINKDIESPWVDKPSSTSDNAFNVKLTAISSSSDAKLVYTTDGSEPTATNGMQVTSGTSVNISASTTLKVGLLVAGTVKNTITRKYTITHFQPTTITIYVRADWPSTYFYAWDASQTLLSAWPGTKITDTKLIDGQTWYYHSFAKNTSSYKMNIIFNKGSNTDQTLDIDNISEDKYFVLSTDKTGGKYTVNDVTGTYTGISVTTADMNRQKRVKVYTSEGCLLRSLPAETSINEAIKDLPKGVYIINNKKIAK